MNQILVTQKLYVTPEIKRKKARYKIMFFVSVFMIFFLLLYYIYNEYDKTKSEAVSKYILAEYVSIPQKQDNTVRNVLNDVLIVSLDADEVNNANTTQTIQPQVQTQTYMASDGTQYMVEAVLNIPSLGINYPILSETSEELLKISLNKYWGPNPNEIGNFCIVGHNYRNGKMFGKLSEIEVGDTIYLTDRNKNKITYKVYNKYVVSPDDVKCTSQLTGGKREVTLITCTNYGTQRLVVKCTEI